MTHCKHCNTPLVQSPIGRQREYCDRKCGWRYRMEVKSGQQRLESVTFSSAYALPTHLMVRMGDKLVMPAPGR